MVILFPKNKYLPACSRTTSNIYIAIIEHNTRRKDHFNNSKLVLIMKLVSFSIMFVFVFTTSNLLAQRKSNLKPGKITAVDFVLPASPAIDSNANAVIMSDIGVTQFVGNKTGYFNYVFKRKTRVKIINKKAFQLATVRIPLYVHNEDKEVLSDLTGSTYNLDNGQLIETKLEKSDIFIDKKDKNHLEEKFTLSAVKEGSIIEYSYTINSDFIFNMPSWEFQNDNYPCLWSEYQVTIPSLLVYIFDKRGVHSFFIDKQDEGHETYMITQQREAGIGSDLEGERLTVNANTVKRRWVMKDVPAFHEEDYLTTPKNYIDRIEFQLHQTSSDGQNMNDVMPTWKKATEDLLKREDFGSFMNSEENSYWMDKILTGIIKENKDRIQQAKDIYYYVANNFTCTNYYNPRITATLLDVYKKHSGSVGDLNLLLAALLQKNKINASPVLLSTREYGFNYARYPIIDRLNYVICRIKLADHVYFLDASHPGLGFGNLPGNCYNGHARIISATDSASVYFMTDSIKERKITIVNIYNDEKSKGALTGNFQNQLGRFESYALRETIAGTGEKKYFDDLKTAARGDIEFTQTGIDSLKNPEDPVKVYGEFALKTGDNADIIYFNPLLWYGYKKNPFAAAERKYPVEMSYPLDDTYTLMVEIPTGFEVDELPKAAKVIYNGQEGFFEYLVQKNETMVQLRCSLKLKKANFDPEDYSSLRDFFGYIVKKQSEQIVFKRKK